MIDFANVGLLGFVKALFPNYVVCWGPTDNSRNILQDGAIIAARNNTLAGSNTAGIPGLVLWNTGTSKRESAWNKPQATQQGFPMGKWSNDSQVGTPGWFNITQTRPVWSEYTLVAWAETLSDANSIERIMWFMDIYKTFDINIQGRTFSLAIVRDGDIDRSWSIQDATSKTLWYQLTMKIKIPTVWIMSEDLPPIDSIVVTYKDIVNGSPVELDQITSIVNPANILSTEWNT